MTTRSKTKIINKPNKALKQLEKLSKSMMGDDIVKVGLPRGSNDYPDGTSVVMVGAVHEFGSPVRGIPQRSYLRSTMITKRKDYKTMFRRLSKKIVEGKLDKEKALNLVGLQVQTDVREKITEIVSPPLRRRKGNPLVDTGHLRQSVVFKVGD